MANPYPIVVLLAPEKFTRTTQQERIQAIGVDSARYVSLRRSFWACSGIEKELSCPLRKKACVQRRSSCGWRKRRRRRFTEDPSWRISRDSRYTASSHTSSLSGRAGKGRSEEDNGLAAAEEAAAIERAAASVQAADEARSLLSPMTVVKCLLLH